MNQMGSRTQLTLSSKDKYLKKMNDAEVNQRIKRIGQEITQCLSFDLPLGSLEAELKDLNEVYYIRQKLNRKKRLENELPRPKGRGI